MKRERLGGAKEPNSGARRNLLWSVAAAAALSYCGWTLFGGQSSKREGKRKRSQRTAKNIVDPINKPK
jgi:hypothetical protein